MLRFKSILSRIVFLHVFAVIGTAILMSLALYWFFDAEVEDIQRRALREQAASLARHLRPLPNGGWSLDLPPGLRDFYSEAYGRYAYSVLDEAHHVIYSSRADRAPIFSENDSSSEVGLMETRRGDQTVSGANLKMELDGRTVWIQVAENLAHRDVIIDDIIAGFFPRVGWITIPILLLLVAIDVLIFRRAVRPLLRASNQAERISPTQIDVRLPVDDIPIEIRSLVMAVNRGLDRLEQGFRLQREFAADVAHELRTPLAVLRARIETLPDIGTATETLKRDVEGMSRVIGQLLDAAEVEAGVIDPNERADLRGVCAEVAESIAPLALAQEKVIALSGVEEPVWVKGIPELLRLAIRNLVENALNHTPKGTDVEIIVDIEGTASVIDQGEGVSVAERERIFERFERRRRGGAGLGLSIVKRITEASGGTVTVENHSGGGAKFSIHFLLAEQPSKASSRPR